MQSALPAVCRRVMLREPGPPSNLTLVSDSPVQPPAASEVTVRVDACAVAFRDVLDRQGAFKFINRPTVLGHEFAGSVAAVGAGVSDFSVGDRVLSLHWDQNAAWPSPLNKAGAVDSMFGLTCFGGYGEFVNSRPGGLAKAPEGFSAAEAACIMSTFGTVWNGAFVRGALQPGQSVLVTGASGGVGSAAIQLAKAHGCRVTGVTTSQAKADYVAGLKADDVVIASEAGEFKAPPHDMVVECVGGPTFTSSLRATAPGGALVLLGNVTNAKVSVPLGFCILNSIAIIGSDSVRRDDLAGALPAFMRKHGIRPQVDRVLPLGEAATAHELLESRGVKGRVVLRVSDDNWV